VSLIDLDVVFVKLELIKGSVHRVSVVIEEAKKKIKRSVASLLELKERKKAAEERIRIFRLGIRGIIQ
jgi:hypothetical protein